MAGSQRGFVRCRVVFGGIKEMKPTIGTHRTLEIFRLISIAIRTTATHDSTPKKIVAETRNILPDVLSFPFTGGSLCEFEDITDVGDNIIVGVGLVMVVATGVEVGVIILGVGLG